MNVDRGYFTVSSFDIVGKTSGFTYTNKLVFVLSSTRGTFKLYHILTFNNNYKVYRLNTCLSHTKI